MAVVKTAAFDIRSAQAGETIGLAPRYQGDGNFLLTSPICKSTDGPSNFTFGNMRVTQNILSSTDKVENRRKALQGHILL